MKRKLIIAIILLGLILAAVTAYWNAPKGDFIWDDISLIVLDYQIKSWNFMREVFTRDFFGFSDDNRKYGYYRPLITISYALDWRAWGLKPAGYHYTNIAMHIVCMVLLFFILYRLADRKLLIPTLAGILFAVHPIHTESVTWIAGRTDVMCAMFFFAGLLTFIVYAERLAAAHGFDELPPGTSPEAARQPRLTMLILTGVFYVIGLLAKEMNVALPVIAGAYLLVFVTGFQWRKIAAYLPSFVFLGVLTIAYFLFRSYRVGFSQQAKQPFDVIETILTFIKTIGYYTGKMLVPVHLSAYIQNPLVQSVFEPKFIAAFVFLAVLIALVVRLLKTEKLIAFSLMFLPLSMLPMSNFIRISGPKDMGFMTAERFLYIPSAAICLLVALLAARLIGKLGALVADRDWSGGRWMRRAVALVLLAAVTLSFTVLTWRRNTDWYDNEKLFTQMIADAPNATLLYVVLGNIYRINKKYDDAEKILQKALEYISPRNREEPTWIYNDLAGIYAEQGRFDEALRVMKLASRSLEHNSAVKYNYGEIYRAMGDCKTAIRYYQHSLSIYRDNLQAFVKMGLCMQQLNSWDLANKAFLSAVSLTPHDASLLNHIGYNYYRLGVYEKAERYLEAALAEDPNLLQATINLAFVHFRQGNADAAIGRLRDLLTQNPDNVELHAALGFLLANQQKYKEAGEHVLRALKLQPKHFLARMTYATVAIETNPAEARHVLAGILKDNPNNAEAMFAMGLSYEREGNKEQAAAWYKKTLQVSNYHKNAIAKLREMGISPSPDE